MVPKIEINGEKVITPAESNSTPDENGGWWSSGGGDVTMILESLNVNGEWKEKGLENLNEKVDEHNQSTLWDVTFFCIAWY